MLNHILIVSEPGRDGVFDLVREHIEHLLSNHPEICVDLAYSSRRYARLKDIQRLIELVESRKGVVVDLEVGNSPCLGDLRAFFSLQNLIAERRPQLIHAHSSKAGALTRLLPVRMLYGAHLIYSPLAYYQMGAGFSLDTLFFHTVERVLIHRAITLACSEDERQFALRSLGMKTSSSRLVYLGVDEKRFRPAKTEEKLKVRRQLGLPIDSRMLVSVGRSSKQKNYEPLYRALDPILAKPDTPLFFVHAGAGSEELRQSLCPQAQKRTKSIRYTSCLNELLQAADGFILASRYEGFSLAVLEALATNLRVFLTKVPGTECLEGLGFDEINWLPGTNYQEILAEKVREWMQAKDGFPIRQRAIIEKGFHKFGQFEKIINVYHELVQTGLTIQR